MKYVRIARSAVAHRSRQLAAAGTAMLMTAPAFAGELADAFQTEATAAKAELLIIGGIVLGVCGVMFLLSRSKKATGG